MMRFGKMAEIRDLDFKPEILAAGAIRGVAAVSGPARAWTPVKPPLAGRGGPILTRTADRLPDLVGRGRRPRPALPPRAGQLPALWAGPGKSRLAPIGPAVHPVRPVPGAAAA